MMPLRALKRLAEWEARHPKRRSFKSLVVTAKPPIYVVTLEDEQGRHVYATEKPVPHAGCIEMIDDATVVGSPTPSLSSTIDAALDEWYLKFGGGVVKGGF